MPKYFAEGFAAFPVDAHVCIVHLRVVCVYGSSSSSSTESELNRRWSKIISSAESEASQTANRVVALTAAASANNIPVQIGEPPLAMLRSGER